MKGIEAEIIELPDQLTLDFKAAVLDSEVTADFETLDNVKANLYSRASLVQPVECQTARPAIREQRKHKGQRIG